MYNEKRRLGAESTEYQYLKNRLMLLLGDDVWDMILNTPAKKKIKQMW